MATTPRKTVEAKPAFDETAKYRIKVKRAVKIGRSTMLRPGMDEIIVDGWLAASIANDILWSEKV